MQVVHGIWAAPPGMQRRHVGLSRGGTCEVPDAHNRNRGMRSPLPICMARRRMEVAVDPPATSASGGSHDSRGSYAVRVSYGGCRVVPARSPELVTDIEHDGI